MIGLNHALSGALVAVLTPVEYLPYVPLIALVLHFLLDMLPHYGKDDAAGVHSKRFKRLLFVDAILCLLAVALACWLYPGRIVWIGLGAVFAVLPDFLWIFRYYAPVKHKFAELFFTFTAKIQWAEYSWAWSLEILYSMIFLTLLVGLS